MTEETYDKKIRKELKYRNDLQKKAYNAAKERFLLNGARKKAIIKLNEKLNNKMLQSIGFFSNIWLYMIYHYTKYEIIHIMENKISININGTDVDVSQIKRTIPF